MKFVITNLNSIFIVLQILIIYFLMAIELEDLDSLYNLG